MLCTLRWRRGRLRRLDLHLCVQAKIRNRSDGRLSDLRVLGILYSGTLARDLGVDARQASDNPFLDFAGCLVSLGLILFFSQSATLLWIGTILFGISQASIFPTFLTL